MINFDMKKEDYKDKRLAITIKSLERNGSDK